MATSTIDKERTGLGKQQIFLSCPSELCRICPVGWDRDVLIKIGHSADIQPERLAWRLPRQGEEIDRCVCLSIILVLLGD